MQSEKNAHVMMIGDGLNDVLSLQEASVGVTINAKSELNLLASDVIILNENLWKIISLFKLINFSQKLIYLNLFWTFSYNIIMTPMAMGIFYSFGGLIMSPIVSSSAMCLSSIIVVLTSNILRFINFDFEKNDKAKLS